MDQPGLFKVKDFISDRTRNIKNILVITSLMQIVIVRGGLIPNSISAFGIELSISNQSFIIGAIGSATLNWTEKLVRCYH